MRLAFYQPEGVVCYFVVDSNFWDGCLDFLELATDPQSLQRTGIEGLFRIGDCVAPQLLADVIFDGHRLGREIDSDDPAIPLPFLREHSRALPTTAPVALVTGSSPTSGNLAEAGQRRH